MSHLQIVFASPLVYFFSMLPSTFEYLYFVKPAGMHFAVKQRECK